MTLRKRLFTVILALAAAFAVVACDPIDDPDGTTTTISVPGDPGTTIPDDPGTTDPEGS